MMKRRERCGGVAFVGTIGIVFGLASMIVVGVVGVVAIPTSTSTSRIVDENVESTPLRNDHSGERDVTEKFSRRLLTFDDLPSASPTKIYPSTERPLGRSRKVDFEVETSRPSDPNFPDPSFDASIDRPSTPDLSTTDSSTSTTGHPRRLATLDSTLDESTSDESTLDDSGG